MKIFAPSFSSVVVLGFSTALLVGCTDGGSALSDPPIVARFSAGAPIPTFLDVPFPNDVYLEADGTIVDALPGLEAEVPLNADAVAASLGAMVGFGRTSGVLFRIDRADETDPDTGEIAAALVDEDSLPPTLEASMLPDSAVALIDLDAAPGDGTRLPCRAAYQDDRPSGSSRRPVLVVLPARGVVLAEGHRYAAVLTSTLEADSGLPVSPSEDFVAIRDGVRRDDPLSKLTGDAVDEVVAESSVSKEDLIALSVFTTQSGSDELVTARKLVMDQPAPTFVWTKAEVAPMANALFTAAPNVAGATATLDDWLGAPAKLPDGTDDPAGDQATGAGHSAIAALATGVFLSPNFLLKRPEGYSNPEHATFARDAMGKPMVNPDAPTGKVWMTVVLPKGNMPASGYPVVIVQHGLGGDRGFVVALADTFAKQGWATVAIESLTFGSRAVRPSDTVDELSRFAWSASAAYSGPDGFVDKNAGPLSLFGELVNFGAARDQIRQSVLDVGALADAIASPTLDLGPLLSAVPGAKLDGSRIVYVGDSFGSIMGTLVAASDPRIRAMVLNVGGGGVLTELVSNAPYLASLLGTAGGLTFGLQHDHLGWQHPLANLLQSIVEPADPLFYADKLVRDPLPLVAPAGGKRSVVMIEALWDEIVANEGTEALALAAGIPLAAPNVGPNGGVLLETVEPTAGKISDVPTAGMTTVLVQASPATHGSDFYNRFGRRHYAYPLVKDDLISLATLPDDISVEQPYLGLQTMAVGFFASAFAGEIPVVAGFPTPVRDYDADGREDSMDLDPNDPSK